MSTKTIPVRYLAAICLGLVSMTCQSDPGGSTGGESDSSTRDTGVEAECCADEQEPADGGPSDGNDGGADAGPSDGAGLDGSADGGETDGEVNVERAVREESRFQRFFKLNDSYALASGTHYRGTETDLNRHYFKLLDVTDPTSIEVEDTRMYHAETTSVAVTPHDEGVLMAKARASDDGLSDPVLVQFAVEREAFEEMGRREQNLQGEAPFESYPRNLVSDGEQAILATDRSLVSISTGSGGLGGGNAPRVDDRIEREPPGGDDLIDGGPNSTLLSDGTFLEIDEGVSIWSFGRTDDDPRRLAREPIDLVTGRRWDYAPAVEHVYIDDPGETFVVDVSDRQDPTVAATWDHEKDFAESVSSPVGFEIIGERLYWATSSSERPQVDEIDIYDISQPTTVDKVTTIELADLPIPDEYDPDSISALGGYGDRLYVGYRAENPPELPEQTIVEVDRKKLEE
jgi:hypothetical protein